MQILLPILHFVSVKTKYFNGVINSARFRGDARPGCGAYIPIVLCATNLFLIKAKIC